ncbi:hypothetical protein ACFXHA_09445 [Nocardia sp. NPDC059240]|uniref:hypothetical protein n=1 Tax=Nocardia sp. NPDC059240 TaxID=3346786 RepID=UPI0036B64E12
MIKRILAATVLTGGLAAGAVGIGAGTASADYWGSYPSYYWCSYWGTNLNKNWHTHYYYFNCTENRWGGWELNAY